MHRPVLTPARAAATPHTAATFTATFDHDLFLDHVNDLVRDAEVLDGTSPDVALGHLPEPVSILRGGDKQTTEIILCTSAVGGRHHMGSNVTGQIVQTCEDSQVHLFAVHFNNQIASDKRKAMFI